MSNLVATSKMCLMELSTAQQTLFRDRGILHLKGAISKKTCAALQQAVLHELDRLNLRVKGQTASSKLQHLPPFQQVNVLGQKVNVDAPLAGLFPAELLRFIGALSGTTVKPNEAVPQLLLSFPHKDEWTLNRLNWHLDLALPSKDEIPGIQAFALIADLKPRGGATLALAGSHRLPYAGPKNPTPALAILREDETFKDLLSGRAQPPEPFFHPRPVNGIEIQVVEMTGQAGDVYLMDLRVLHSPSLNATRAIRMMATGRFIKADRK